MIVRFFTISYFLLVCMALKGQHDANFYADVMVTASNPQHQREAGDKFIELAIPIMKSDSTFTHRFRWLGASVLYAPDTSFRILSFRVPNLESESNSFSVIGYFQAFGSGNLIELNDKSSYERNNETGILYPHRWVGAIYSDVKQVPNNDSLFLVYGRSPIDSHKMLHVLDIIDFRDQKLKFGYPLWQNKDSTMSVRKIWTVANGAQFTPYIHPNGERIVVDHLSSVPYNQKSSIMVNVPDGTYVFYDWEKDKWIYNDRLFDDDQERVIRNPKKRKKAAERDLFGNPK
ncbi:MAG: hypothetical protein GVX78_03560 [Bacteroidetes bacterium]|nr:hypothetical protein [Bacteroidota bacterium]